MGHAWAWGKLRSSRTPGAASSHATLVRAMTQCLHTVPQRNSSMCMWITLGVLGTSRVNVDEDLMMAVQTLKNRSLDTHEEIVHSDTDTALGIHNDHAQHAGECGSNALVASETRSSMGAALSGSARKNMEGALGAHDLCGSAQTRRTQCALCPQ